MIIESGCSQLIYFKLYSFRIIIIITLFQLRRHWAVQVLCRYDNTGYTPCPFLREIIFPGCLPYLTLFPCTPPSKNYWMFTLSIAKVKPGPVIVHTSPPEDAHVKPTLEWCIE